MRLNSFWSCSNESKVYSTVFAPNPLHPLPHYLRCIERLKAKNERLTAALERRKGESEQISITLSRLEADCSALQVALRYWYIYKTQLTHSCNACLHIYTWSLTGKFFDVSQNSECAQVSNLTVLIILMQWVHVFSLWLWLTVKSVKRLTANCCHFMTPRNSKAFLGRQTQQVFEYHVLILLTTQSTHSLI